MADTIKLRRDTAANWKSANPVLSEGEVGIETDTRGYKVGDGTTAWNSLIYHYVGKTVLEAIAMLQGQIAGVRALAKNPGDLNAKSLNSEKLPMVDGFPISFQGEGAPKQVPRFIGQRYLDVETGALYEAISLTNSVNDWLLIEGLQGATDDRFTDTSKYLIQSTGGDLSIASGAMSLVALSFMLDSQCNPSTPTAFRFNGANAIISTQVLSSVDISGGHIISGSKKIIFFHCVKGTWAGYGSSAENNGYVVIDKDGNDVAVDAYYSTYSTTNPAVGDSVSACTVKNSNGKKFYLPNEGWMLLLVESDVEVSDLCARLAWSYGYSKYEARVQSQISLSTAMAAIHSGGWGAGIVFGSRKVADAIVLDLVTPANSKWYRNIDRTLLPNLTWSVEADESETVYTFKATISNAAVEGLFQSETLGAMQLVNGQIVWQSSTITTVNALKTALAGEYGYFELFTPVSDVVEISGNVVNGSDFGTNEVLGTTVAPYVTCSYRIGLKDYLRSLPSAISEYNRVNAEAFALIDSNIRGLKVQLENLGHVKAENVDSENFQVCGNDLIIVGAGAPTVVPRFVGQRYLDKTNFQAYTAYTLTNQTSDWHLD